jgi:hypothetical protein
MNQARSMRRVRPAERPSPSQAMNQNRVLRRGVDQRRLLQPWDYFADPHQFGRDLSARIVTPSEGDRASRDLAELFHRAVCFRRSLTHISSGADLGRQFAFSRQTWSAAVLGKRWPPLAVFMALLIDTQQAIGRVALAERDGRVGSTSA